MAVDQEAWNRFLASAPEGVREYRTIELSHPEFSAGQLRFVKDYVDADLGLEADAPRNPGEVVTFTAIAMDVKEPDETGDAEQILQINLGAVGGEVQDVLKEITAAGVLTPIQVIYRKYYGGDLTEPVVRLSLSASGLKFKSYAAVAFTAEDIDLAVKPSGEIYTTERFPGLVGV